MAAKPRRTTASYEHRARDEFEFGRLGLKALADVANGTGSVMCCPFQRENFDPVSHNTFKMADTTLNQSRTQPKQRICYEGRINAPISFTIKYLIIMQINQISTVPLKNNQENLKMPVVLTYLNTVVLQSIVKINFYPSVTFKTS